jgi:hypothetical protein
MGHTGSSGGQVMLKLIVKRKQIMWVVADWDGKSNEKKREKKG